MSEDTDFVEWEVPDELSDEEAISSISEFDFEFGYDESDNADELLPVVPVIGRTNVGRMERKAI